jgi:hypothetical protein
VSNNDDTLAQALREELISSAVSDDNGVDTNIADSINHVANAISHGLSRLGNADESTPFGALESHGMAILQGAEKISTAMSWIADAITDLASAIRERSTQ